VHCTIRLF